MIQDIKNETDEEDRQLRKSLQLIAKAKEERDAIEKQMPELLRRKAEAEAKIKDLTEERLREAERVSDAAAEKALFATFMIGGIGSVQLKTKERLTSTQSKPGATMLTVGSYIMAVRLDSPCYPGMLFLLGTGGNLHEGDKQRLARLEACVVEWMRPYAWVPVDAVRTIAQDYVQR